MMAGAVWVVVMACLSFLLRAHRAAL